eukprot:2251968-Amphidinium_carterae.2
MSIEATIMPSAFRTAEYFHNHLNTQRPHAHQVLYLVGSDTLKQGSPTLGPQTIVVQREFQRLGAMAMKAGAPFTMQMRAKASRQQARPQALGKALQHTNKSKTLLLQPYQIQQLSGTARTAGDNRRQQLRRRSLPNQEKPEPLSNPTSWASLILTT